jgi:hypothetical protein
MGRRSLLLLTHAAPSLSLLLILWSLRPSWLRFYSSQRPKAQFWSDYIEAAYVVPTAGLLVLIGLVSHAAWLFRTPEARTRQNYFWLGALLVLTLCLVVPVTNWISNWIDFLKA